MNSFHRVIHPDYVLCDVQARSRKHCLEILSGLLARPHPGIGEEEVFESLIERERLGCTGLGQGIAFPHCRLNGAETSTGALIRLAEPIEFEAPDGLPVDLVVGLLVPAELGADQRGEIAEMTRLLGEQDLRDRLRAARDRDELYAALVADRPAQQPPRRARG